MSDTPKATTPMSEAKCEVSEEQVRSLWTLVMGQSIDAGCDAIRQALAQEAQRANERAEGLAKELEAERAARMAEIESSEAALGMANRMHTAATARVAELEKQLAEGQAELARLRALPGGDKPLVYLACPYTHKDRAVRVSRFNAANEAASKLMLAGEFVFSPISHTHPIAEAGGLPLGWDFWEGFDRAYIGHSKKLIVLRVDGWAESTGVRAEIAIAQEARIPVEYIDPAEGHPAPLPSAQQIPAPDPLRARLEEAEIGLCAHADPMVPTKVIFDWLQYVKRGERPRAEGHPAPQATPEAEGRSATPRLALSELGLDGARAAGGCGRPGHRAARVAGSRSPRCRRSPPRLAATRYPRPWREAMIRHALAEALGVVEPPDMSLETVDVEGAAALLHTTKRAIYQRRHAGQMPRPVTRRPLVWRRADLIALPK